jgi:hypothetical protein
LVLAGCTRLADQPIEGWPVRSVLSSAAEAARISRDISSLGSNPGAFALSWSETELTSYLGSTLPVGDKVVLWCEPGQVFLRYQSSRLKGHSVSARISPRLVNQQLLFDIKGIWLDNRPLGPWFAGIIKGMLNDVLIDALGQYRFQEITVEPGQIRIRGELG